MEDEDEIDLINLTVDKASELCDREKELGKKDVFKIFHVNLRSLRKNWDYLNILLDEASIEWDIICLTEISIKEDETSLYEIENYTAVWLTRETTKTGGGLAIFVNNKYEGNYDYKIGKLGTNDLISLNINNGKENTEILFSYRQPNSVMKEFLDDLAHLIKSYKLKENVIWIGDVNIDILDLDRQNKEMRKSNKKNLTSKDRYLNMLAKAGFEKKINTATREELKGNKLTKSCIDHVFAKLNKFGQSSGFVVKEKIADHYITGILFKHETTKKIEKNETCDNILRNDQKIIKALQNVNWEQIKKFNTSEEMYEESLKIIHNIAYTKRIQK